MTIKYLIFDLGGVILNIDFQKTIDAFRTLGAFNADTLFEDNKNIIRNFSLGKIDASTFRNTIIDEMRINITNQEFDYAWNAMLLDIPKHNLEVIHTLKQHYQCILFSNTNIIHHQCVINILQRDCGASSFAEFFEKEYYSYLMGLSKPDKAAFEIIIDENHLVVAETLLIDDTFENIIAAKALGLHAHHLRGELREIDLLGYLDLCSQ